MGERAIGRVGFLADTHSRKDDGSDLPDGVLGAFEGVDLIVHLGDIGKKAILDRLGAVAPVWVPDVDRKGYVPHAAPAPAPAPATAPVKVLRAGDRAIGLCFNLAQPDKKIAVGDDGIAFPDGDLEPLLQRRFKEPVSIVAFAGTHRQHVQRHEGVLFFNPGSPTLPADARGEGDRGGVAILDLSRAEPAVELVRIRD